MVNKGVSVNIGPRFEAHAIHILRGIPELEVAIAPDTDARGDAVVQYAGMKSPVAVELKTKVSYMVPYAYDDAQFPRG